jgi:hypothetical protein
VCSPASLHERGAGGHPYVRAIRAFLPKLLSYFGKEPFFDGAAMIKTQRPVWPRLVHYFPR